VPTGHHPHCQSPGGGQAGRQDEQDDKQLLIALIARQMREQQLARASYKIFGHNVKMVFPVAVAHRNLCATIGAMDSCCLFPKNNSNEIYCSGSKYTKPVENKMGLEGTTINCLFETWSASNRQHQPARTNGKHTFCTEKKYAAARFGQEADTSLILLSCPGSLHECSHQCLGFLHDEITSGALPTIEEIFRFGCLGSLQNRACNLDMMVGR
jgi:type II secretory pathway pseudopilin PulG